LNYVLEPEAENTPPTFLGLLKAMHQWGTICIKSKTPSMLVKRQVAYLYHSELLH
jgi:hypothetical protein